MDMKRRQVLLGLPAVLIGGSAFGKLAELSPPAPDEAEEFKEFSASGEHWFGHVPRKEEFATMNSETRLELACCVALQLAAESCAAPNPAKVPQVDRALGFLREEFPEFFKPVVCEYMSMLFDSVRRPDPPSFHNQGVGVHDPAGVNWPTFELKIALLQSVYVVVPGVVHGNVPPNAKYGAAVFTQDQAVGKRYLFSGGYYMHFYCFYPEGGHGGSLCLNDPFERKRALQELNGLAKRTKILAAKKYIDTFRRAINPSPVCELKAIALPFDDDTDRPRV